MKINLEDYEPQVPFYRDFFRERGIKQLVIANYLGVSQGTLSALFNGYRPIPKHHQKKLDLLVNSVQGE